MAFIPMRVGWSTLSSPWPRRDARVRPTLEDGNTHPGPRVHATCVETRALLIVGQPEVKTTEGTTATEAGDSED